MNPFGVVSPTSWSALGQLLADAPSTTLIGGGTLAVPRWVEGGRSSLLVCLRSLPLWPSDGQRNMPAKRTLAQLSVDPAAPACLSAAAASIANQAVREVATVGGNVAAGEPACVAVALIALQAEVLVWEPAGRLRQIAVVDLFDRLAALRDSRAVLANFTWQEVQSSAFFKIRAHGTYGPPLLSLALALHAGSGFVIACGAAGLAPRALPESGRRLDAAGPPRSFEEACALVADDDALAGLDRSLVAAALWKAFLAIGGRT